MKQAVLILALCACTRALAAAPDPREVGVDDRMGALVPLDAALTDENGRAVRLGDALAGGRPVLLVLTYFRCPGLCDLVLRGLVGRVDKLGLRLGRDYRAVALSIDPTDRPDEARRRQGALLQQLGRPDATADWRFLVGNEAAVRAVAASLGFRYVYDPRSQQYAHPAASFVLTPEGRLSRVLDGVDPPLLDLRLALDDAAGGHVGSFLDRLLITCFHWDPASRRYGVYVAGVLEYGAALVLLLVCGLVGSLVALERRQRRAR